MQLNKVNSGPYGGGSSGGSLPVIDKMSLSTFQDDMELHNKASSFSSSCKPTSSSSSSSAAASVSTYRGGHCLACVILAVSRELASCGIYNLVRSLALSVEESIGSRPGPHDSGRYESSSFGLSSSSKSSTSSNVAGGISYDDIRHSRESVMHISSLEMYSLVYKIMSAKYKDIYSSCLSMGKRFGDVYQANVASPSAPPSSSSSSSSPSPILPSSDSSPFPLGAIDDMFQALLCGPFYDCTRRHNEEEDDGLRGGGKVADSLCEFCNTSEISSESVKGGRYLKATRNANRGDLLLRESPIASVLSLSCGCHSDSLLVEHILLAWSLASYKTSDEYIATTDLLRAERSEEIDVPLLELGLGQTKEDMLKHVLKNFTSGLCDNILHGADDASAPNMNPSIGIWPLHVQVLLAIICVNCELFSKYHRKSHEMISSLSSFLHTSNIDNNSSSNSSGSYSTSISDKDSGKVSSLCNGLTMFMLLARFPTNTLAVTKVVTINAVSNDNNPITNKDKFNTANPNPNSNSNPSSAATTVIEEIEQRRLGYGVFRSTSSINHSCKPNALVRFNVPQPLRGSLFNKYAPPRPALTDLQLLKETYVEVVSTTQIAKARGVAAAKSDGGVSSISKSSGSSGGRGLSGPKCRCSDCFRSHSDDGEIAVSYGPLQSRMASKRVRRELLRDQYLFHCRCEACSTCESGLIDDNDLHHNNNNNSTTNKGTTISAKSTLSSNNKSILNSNSASSLSKGGKEEEIGGGRRASKASLTIQLCQSIDSITTDLNLAMPEFDKLISVNSQLSRTPHVFELKILQDFDVEKLAVIQSRCGWLFSTFLNDAFDHRTGFVVVDTDNFLDHLDKSRLDDISGVGSVNDSCEYIIRLLLQILIPPTNKTNTTSINKTNKTSKDAAGMTPVGAVFQSKSSSIKNSEIVSEFITVFATLLDMRGRLLSKCNSFGKAAIAVATSIFLLVHMEIYSSSDVEIGRELVKLSQLLMVNSLPSSKTYCKRILQFAMECLVEVVVASDPDFIEAKCMLRLLSS